MFDPHLLQEANGILKSIFRVEDYASDSVVLGLATLKVVKALYNLNSDNAGNSIVRQLLQSIFISYYNLLTSPFARYLILGDYAVFHFLANAFVCRQCNHGKMDREGHIVLHVVSVVYVLSP